MHSGIFPPHLLQTFFKTFVVFEVQMSLKQKIEHKVDILETKYKDVSPYFPGTCSCFFSSVVAVADFVQAIMFF